MICENKVTISGKVIKEPNFNKTNSGKSVCKINIVVEKKIGHMKRSDFIPIAMWGKKADIAKDKIQKGDSIVVSGSIAQERWETQNQERRSRIVIQAEKFWVIPNEYHDYEEPEVDGEHTGKDFDQSLIDSAEAQYDGLWNSKTPDED
jgi:single-strand DNA-binding protein